MVVVEAHTRQGLLTSPSLAASVLKRAKGGSVSMLDSATKQPGKGAARLRSTTEVDALVLKVDPWLSTLWRVNLIVEHRKRI